MKKGVACLILSLIVMLLHASGVEADHPDYVSVGNVNLGTALGTTNEWSATAYQVRETDTVSLEMTEKPARLCFNPLNDSGTRQCFYAKDGSEAFPIFVELKLVAIRESRSPKSGVLFVAEAGGKVEPTRLITIWTYHSRSGTFHNLLPTTRINLQGEYVIIPNLHGIEGVFVTANRIWNAERETLYGNHNYTIRIYTLQNAESYGLKRQYVTRKKYPGLDDAEKIDVISSEMKTIKKLIGSKP
ncbi:MAG: hypothetical protein HPY67_11445 [Syntrophaceae bacterium]|nr:hypothetical protein [Syntrophaceae bacterium]